MYEVAQGGNVTRFLHSGDDLVAEYNGSGTILRRYVHGIGAGDDPLLWYEGSAIGVTTRRILLTEHLGSTICPITFGCLRAVSSP